MSAKAIWGNSSMGYSFQPSNGASGGLLTVWDCDVVQVWSTTRFPHVLIIRGSVLQTNQEFVIANVYVPCDSSMKQVLWDQLLNFALNNGDVNLCICRDFNSIRSMDERMGCGSMFCQHESDIFNKFIEDGSFVDLSIYGRLFTWYR